MHSRVYIMVGCPSASQFVLSIAAAAVCDWFASEFCRMQQIWIDS